MREQHSTSVMTVPLCMNVLDQRVHNVARWVTKYKNPYGSLFYQDSKHPPLVTVARFFFTDCVPLWQNPWESPPFWPLQNIPIYHRSPTFSYQPDEPYRRHPETLKVEKKIILNMLGLLKLLRYRQTAVTHRWPWEKTRDIPSYFWPHLGLWPWHECQLWWARGIWRGKTLEVLPPLHGNSASSSIRIFRKATVNIHI